MIGLVFYNLIALFPMLIWPLTTNFRVTPSHYKYPGVNRDVGIEPITHAIGLARAVTE